MPAPKRMTLGDLDSGGSITAQYNPAKVQVALQAYWTKTKVPGQTYEELLYAGTGNPEITFDLAFDGKSTSLPKPLKEVENFLHSLLYAPLKPTGGGSGLGSPSRVLFSWPSWILLVSALPKFTQTTTRWELSGEPNYQVYSVTLESRLTRRIGSEEIRRNALKRSA